VETGAATVDHRCVKTEEHAVTAGHSVNRARWQEAFEGLMSRIAGRFTRAGSRRRARKLVLGLLSDLPRKNCWTIAERAADRTPDGMQHLLGRAKRDADQVRDDVSDYVVEHLHDDEAVLVVDETGDVKKGTSTVGARRQYTGTAGRIENARVAVCLVCAGRRGHAAVDRELYVPRSRTSDPDRCRAAGPGDKTEFATKPELAARMVTDSRAPATRPSGSREMKPAAATRGCAPRWRNAAPATSSQWLARTKSPQAPGSSARTRWPGRCPGGPGRSCPQGSEPRATASATGPSSTSPTPCPGAGSC
jgi:hypothetical protein